MPAAAGDTAAAAAPAAALQATFKQLHYANEVADWLAHRATPGEVQRFDRYMQLIEQAAGGAPSSTDHAPASDRLKQTAARPRPCSTLGFTPAATKKHHGSSNGSSARPASASPNSSSWMYSNTTKAAGKAAAAAVGPPSTTSLLGRGLRPYSAAPAVTNTASSPAAANKAALAAVSRNISSTTSSNTCSEQPKCVNITTAQAFHGLKELYPDLWAATAPICRPQPAPNKNFISEWGESLRQSAAEAWAPYLASTYQVANLQVAKPTDEFAVRADDALVSWAAKQKLYLGDLLAPQAAAAAAALLEGRQPGTAAGPAAAAAPAGGDSSGDPAAAAAAAGVAGLSLAERKELLGMLRQLAAVVKPDSSQSITHTTHKPQYSVEQPDTTALMKEQTRIRTMGFPRKVEVKGFAHTATKAATAAAATAAASSNSSNAASAGSLQQAGSRPAGKPVKAAEMIDTLSSKVPLKWASHPVEAPSSSYTAAFGRHPGRAPQMFKTVFKEVNVGFGHVDQTLYPTGNGAYPVEQLYLEQPIVPGETQHEADSKTTMRMSYKPRDPETVARSVAAAGEQIEASQAARYKSLIPLSKAGIQFGSSAQWRSAYGADFIPRKADLAANAAMAHAVSAMFNGPTIAYGKIAGMTLEDTQKISKWKSQQEAEAAAKAASEAALDKRAAAAAAAASAAH